MANLYQIRGEIENFTFEIDPETGEFVNGSAWDELQMAYEEKVENFALYIKNLRYDRDAIDHEISELTKRHDRLTRRINYLEGLLSSNMLDDKFSTPKCEISFRASKAVEIKDQNAIPEELMRVNTSRTPDKKAIGAFLKEGKEVPGCELVERKNITIK